MYNNNLKIVDEMIEAILEQQKNFMAYGFYQDKEQSKQFSYLGRELLKLQKFRDNLLSQKLAWKEDARRDLASHSKAVELATLITEKHLDVVKVAENAEITNQQGKEFGEEIVENKAWREPWKS